MAENDRTLFCGNLHEDVTEELLYELFIQGGPLDQVKIPATDGRKKSYGFITFRHVDSVPYTMQLLSDARLFGRTLRLQFRSGSIHEQHNQMDYNMQPQQRAPPPHHRMSNMQPNVAMPLMMGQGLMRPPAAAPYMMVAHNPLCPPMAAVLQDTNFHRSFSAPDFGSRNPQAHFAGPLMGQNQSRDGGKGSRDNSPYSRDYSPDPSQDSRDRNSRDKSQHSRKRSHDDRSRRSPGDDQSASWDQRSGDNYKDRSRDARRGRQPDNRDDRRHREDARGDREDHRDDSRDERRRDHGGSSGRHNRQEAKDQTSQATLNFRRQMASPPWQRSKPPWQQ